VFYKNGEDCGGVSDFAELVGLLTGESVTDLAMSISV